MMAKGSWPYRVTLAAPFVKANTEEIIRWLADDPVPRSHRLRGPEGELVCYCFAAECDAAMFQWRFGGQRVDKL